MKLINGSFLSIILLAVFLAFFTKGSAATGEDFFSAYRTIDHVRDGADEHADEHVDDHGDAVVEEHADEHGHDSLNMAFVLTGSGGAGSFSTIDMASMHAVNSIGSLHDDAAVRAFDNLVYVLNSPSHDQIQVLNPSSNFATLAQYSAGNGSNPHDMAFVSEEKAYVSLYDASKIWIVNPLTGQSLGEIDLSSYADADGNPEVDQLFIQGTNLYASIQRLDRNNSDAPTNTSSVLVVDTQTDQVTNEIPLTFPHPVTGFAPLSNGDLLIPCVGNFGIIDGAIETIHTQTHTSSVVMTEEVFGGDAYEIAMIHDSKGYVVVLDSSFNTSMVSFDPSSGTQLATILVGDGTVISDLAVNANQQVYVTYRDSSSPGIRIFDGNTDIELTSTPISTGLLPFEIVILE